MLWLYQKTFRQLVADQEQLKLLHQKRFLALSVKKKIKLFWNIKKLKKKRTCVSAEHSTYLTALNSLASFSPASLESGFCLFFANLSMVATSSRKSICVPTSRNGVFWQWCEISGTHCKTRLKIWKLITRDNRSNWKIEVEIGWKNLLEKVELE